MVMAMKKGKDWRMERGVYAWRLRDVGLRTDLGGGWLRSAAAAAVSVAAATRSSSSQRCPGIATLRKHGTSRSVLHPTRWSRCITQPRYGADLLLATSSPL